MRALGLVLALGVALSGCDRPTSTDAGPASVVDRSEAPRPEGTVVELALDGGDAALVALAAQLPPSTLRSAFPSHVSVWLDGLIETPAAIRSRVASGSPVRLVMARVDGELRSAVAVRLDEAVPGTELQPGGPRGSARVGDRAAVDERIAVVSDDPAMLELAFAYLAYTALAQPSEHGAIVAHLPASSLATVVRSGLSRMLDDQRRALLASIVQARAAHAHPPDLGDPEALVTLVTGAIETRLAYLPDLGEATVRLAPTASGLALTMEADVQADSPLAAAIAATRPVAPSFVAAMPADAAIAIATGAGDAMRAESSAALVDGLASVAGDRMAAAEREALTSASGAIATLRGEEGALAIGATETGGSFVLTATRSGIDGPAPAPWGRALPWTSGLLGALFGCTPVAPRVTAAGTVLCGDVAIVTRASGGVRTDVLGRSPALAEPVSAAIAAGASASSPDLARDLAALPAGTFALLLARPLRALPLMVALGGPPRTGLPRGDGAAVLAFARDGDRLSLSLRASTAAMADLDVVIGLFADETDSE